MRHLLTAMAFAALLPLAAHANTFDIAYTDGAVSGTLVLTTTTTTLLGYYVVTSITGEQNGAPVSLLAPATYGANDNYFSPTSPFLDDNGIGFAVAGFGDSNLYYDGPNATDEDRLCTDSEYCLGVSPGTAATVALTPEPSSLILLGTGILSAAGAARRRFRRA